MLAMVSFPPDSPLVARVAPSPNYDERAGKVAPDILLLHYTGMPSAAAALERLREPQSRVSCHYFVDEYGETLQLVPEAQRAWHAGASFWERGNDINSRSIGVEIVNPGHEFGYRDFSEPQVAAVIALARDVVARWSIRADRVLAHSDVAPTRKEDPGERFPWGRLAEAGIGLWVPPIPIMPGAALSLGEEGEEVARLQHMLFAYGYGIDQTGVYDSATAAVVTAFQRHFRPARVDGRADASTLRTLEALIAARAAVAPARGAGSSR